MYIPTQQSSPSAQAMDLGHRIASLVRAHLAENPGTRSSDIAQSFTVARQLLRSELGSTSSRTLAIVTAGLVALAVAGVAALLAATGEPGFQLPALAPVVVLLAIAAVAAALARQGR